ncbi:MAG: 1-acyl-sn-glycerol-3-phosphate acyltransferase [Deltaproteobacteria bacterium]|nr:1-acyl-sn-glycerol-3-phosphate acyltransferase [Deltaproteobacteria bacterium]
MRPEHRERARIEAATRVVDRHVAALRPPEEVGLEALVNDTLYHERRRLERDRGGDPRNADDSAFYHRIQKRLRHASARDLREMLDQIALRFASEIVGNFDDRVYKLSTTVVPTGLSVLLTAMSPGKLGSLGSLRHGLSDHVQIQGTVDHVRKLLDKGTLVVVPTHSSHLDSIVLGYAVHLLGLPPLLYGAGLNLFKNPVTSFFMNNLGAYRVDRKKTAALYKEVLKEYATVALELDYNNLFFPGGTRSRSGAVEQKLKRGLLGTAVRAYVGNLQSRRDKPNLYVVPCTISYKLGLEAETLIDDYLKEVGKNRYIIEDDEFSRPRQVLNFMSNLVSLDSRVVITFSRPLDVVGNFVDEEGRSLDPRGRVVDAASYVSDGGVAVHDAQRDEEYTNELSAAIAREFLRDNLAMSTHVVGYALLDMIQRENPDMDLYRLLRTGGRSPSVTATDLARETERVIGALSRSTRGPRLSDELSSDPAAVVDDALRAFGSYHTHAAAVRRGDRVFHENRNLLLYYGNRLKGYDLGRNLARPSGEAAEPAGARA